MAQLLDSGFVAARQEQTALRLAANTAQGDSDEQDDTQNYVELPAKGGSNARLTASTPIPAPVIPASVPTAPKHVAMAAAAPARIVPAPPTPSQTAAAPAAPKSNDIPGELWGIQIGAYLTPETGWQALDSLTRSMPQMLGSATPVVDKVTSDHGILYRARLTSLDERSAETACAWLNQHGQSCMTVGP
jgi:hypothetical protein